MARHGVSDLVARDCPVIGLLTGFSVPLDLRGLIQDGLFRRTATLAVLV